MAREPREPDVKFTVPSDLTIADIKNVLEEVLGANTVNNPSGWTCGYRDMHTRRTAIILDDES